MVFLDNNAIYQNIFKLRKGMVKIDKITNLNVNICQNLLV